mgnify:CR=1 FL=1
MSISTSVRWYVSFWLFLKGLFFSNDAVDPRAETEPLHYRIVDFFLFLTSGFKFMD